MKKFLSLVVAALLSVSAIATSASAAKFADVDASNEALTDAVELLAALNVTKGVSETEFGTANNVTREQMAAFIYRMMKAGKSVEGGTNNTTFVDLEDPTFFFMISWANSQGIIKGTSDTTFNPKGGITLQDAYTMIVRALGYDDGTLAYPIGYISKAEELELDADLPATLGYTDTLTRGDLAIILANMFYAETAEVEIKYESTWIEVEDSQGNPHIVSNGQVPVEYHKTVAEKIFEVEKVSQRVVATPNYSFEGNEMPDEDVEMLTLSADYVIDYADYETDIPSLGQVEFAALGLEGKADDYFLSDIVMFVKEVDGEYEVFGATATGTKETVSFEDVKFGTVSGTAAEKYYDGEDKEYKMISGKLTLGDTVTYLFDAPYSFAKDQDTQKYNAQFITLGEFDDGRDVEEDVVDVNFSYVLDAQDMDDSLIGATYDDVDGWALDYNGYLSQVYYGGLGEIDVYDCDGNGKPDYLFVKNYTVGTIETEEDGRMYDEVDTFDATDAVANVVIYTDKSIVEGAEAEDKDIVLAYVNAAANYVKVAEVLTGKDASITSQASKYFALATGEKIYYKDAQAVVVNGATGLAAVDAEADVNFDAEATYFFAANGKLVYVKGLESAINVNENWVVVLDADVTTTTTMIDGKLEKADYIEIYNGGEIKAVKAKKIAEDKDVDGDRFVETPATYDLDSETYDFSDYVGKLATGKSDKNGAYYFQLVDFGKYADDTAFAGLADREEAANEYRQTGVSAKLTKKSGNLYVIEDADADANVNGLRGVYVKDYTQIIIKSLDENGDTVVTLYGADNLPNINENHTFTNVSYVLMNNTSSRNSENLVVFYGELNTELTGDPGEVADVRIVKGYSRINTEDGSLYIYDVFNPFTGATESSIEAAETDDNTPFVAGDIVGLTTEGYIDNSGEAAGSVAMSKVDGEVYDVDDTFETLTDLGWVEVVEYDETTGFLEVEGNSDILKVTDDTAVSFLDLSAETIQTVDASILGSTSKTYRYLSEKTNALRVFLCIEEDVKASDDDETVYNINFAVIVRD